MFILPLYLFLFAYFAFLLLFLTFAFFNVGHIVHTGSMTGVSFAVTLVSMVLTVFIFYATYLLLMEVDWQTIAITIDLQWVKNLFSGNQMSF
ncbi:MAG: hypothetical protein Q7S66_04365 [bacterium]|nr:hypothetical protein [bacterium]